MKRKPRFLDLLTTRLHGGLIGGCYGDFILFVTLGERPLLLQLPATRPLGCEKTKQIKFRLKLDWPPKTAMA